MEKIQVFVITNNKLFRKGLRLTLNEMEDIEVVGEVDISDEALELVLDSVPRVVLLDVGLPLLIGLNLGRQITQSSLTTSVVVLTPYNGDDNHLFNAIKSGAVGYISMDASAEEIASAIRAVARAEYIICELVLARPKLAEKILKQFQDFALKGGAMEALAMPLTKRELEVLNHVAQGYSNKQVAYKLSVAEQTIKTHMTSILRKLDANDRTEAVVLALHHGWIYSRTRKSP